MRGFETREQENEFWEFLKLRSVPLKFAYVGPAASTHDVLAKGEAYHEVSGRGKFEVSALRKAGLGKKKEVDICEVGPGNGFNSAAFLRAYLRFHPLKRYLGLDFSETLLSMCTARLADHFPRLQIDSAIWDFEKGPTKEIRRWRQGTVLVAFIGATLGNPSKPRDVLHNIRESCEGGDYLLLGVALMHDGNTGVFLEPYRNNTFKVAALKPLEMAGIDTSKGDFSLSFLTGRNEVIGEFVLDEPQVVRFGSESLHFESGERIKCFISKRFLDGEVKDLLAHSGWNLVSTTYDYGFSHGVYVSRK